LSVGRHGQRFFGAFMDELSHVFAQGVRGFFQGFEHHRVVTPSVEHAHRLGALTGKNKSKRGHVQIFYQRKI